MSKQDDFRESFFEECEELLEAMHDGFDRMAQDLEDSETMHAIFRAVHSIKGGAGAFGLNDLVAFAHHFETALDKVRSGSVKANDELLELFRKCGDHLSDLVAAARNGEGEVEGTEALRESLNETIGEDTSKEVEMPDFEPVTLQLDMDIAPVAESSGFEIEFSADPELFTSANEPVLLFQALERLGKLEVEADLEAVPHLSELVSSVCAIRWKLTLDTDASESDVRETFDFVEDTCQLEVRRVGDEETSVPEELPTLGLPSLSDVTPAAEAQEETKAPAAPPAEPKKEPKKAPSAEKSEQRKPAGTIRVDLEKVDKLINLVGELVIKEAMLSQSIAEFDPPSESDVSVGLDNLKQLASEIQEGVMAIRAQPVKPMFQRMSRIVREAASATGKRVKFVTKGEYTEVDKTVIERLVDPLTHMIRNAIDHGLEKPDEREANGKDGQGTVTLEAAHRSGRVMIDISDDGGGINRDRVRQIAIDKGLVSESADLAPTEIDNLLFLPGFSSKAEVSELSGRGVGLDVARSEIQGLGGRVSIQSKPGEGTIFSISLPLTLAVLEGMVIKVADQTMVVPISTIQETLQPNPEDIHTIGSSGRILHNRNSFVPIIDLGSFFGFRHTPESPEDHVLLLVESDNNQRYALIADEIQDQRQVVIKSLETNYQQISGVAAATILGDGRIALIIDPDNIIKDSGSASPGDFPIHMAG
ncbi:Signal transduction histidine kinase CheA [Candidatus Rhodobacter oscarellae]|uniref:Chemotaxis protein CheA n=1 Tax=Candidatus Rhodobacter oscarellae TaxID=1675527 RepID=A0A0J9ED04_9RHOB|nr:chemotaxis protein CheA [Candidatus Rhodobacter lobularis]KMW60667.1 Signal transduction histidine kinase CheA [Candidatus Rhodobacter lobularis]